MNFTERVEKFKECFYFIFQKEVYTWRLLREFNRAHKKKTTEKHGAIREQ